MGQIHEIIYVTRPPSCRIKIRAEKKRLWEEEGKRGWRT